MRHYESLDQAFEELREPNMQEIEGMVNVFGKRFYISGKTLPIHPPAFSGNDNLPKEMYKIWVEEMKPKEDPQTLFSDFEK